MKSSISQEDIDLLKFYYSKTSCEPWVNRYDDLDIELDDELSVQSVNFLVTHNFVLIAEAHVSPGNVSVKKVEPLSDKSVSLIERLVENAVKSTKPVTQQFWDDHQASREMADELFGERHTFKGVGRVLPDFTYEACVNFPLVLPENVYVSIYPKRLNFIYHGQAVGVRTDVCEVMIQSNGFGATDNEKFFSEVLDKLENREQAVIENVSKIPGVPLNETELLSSDRRLTLAKPFWAKEKFLLSYPSASIEAVINSSGGAIKFSSDGVKLFSVNFNNGEAEIKNHLYFSDATKLRPQLMRLVSDALVLAEQNGLISETVSLSPEEEIEKALEKLAEEQGVSIGNS